MILDSDLIFTGTSKGATGGIEDGPNTDAPTAGTQAASNVIDLGLAGLPTSANGGGARDIGVGDDPMMKLLIVVTTAFTGGTSLQAQLQGAPDNGSGAAGSYTTMWTGPAVALANLLVGAYLANVDVPRVIPGQALPRFLQLNFITVGTMTAGDVEAGIVLDRFDQVTGTTGALSGYPAGIVVAN